MLSWFDNWFNQFTNIQQEKLVSRSNFIQLIRQGAIYTRTQSINNQKTEVNMSGMKMNIKGAELNLFSTGEEMRKGQLNVHFPLYYIYSSELSVAGVFLSAMT